VNQPFLNALHPDEVDVVIQRVDEAEVDEMWSYVGKKHEQRCLWHAIDHQTGQVLAYVCGRRQDQVFLQRKALLELLVSRAMTPTIWAHMHGISIPTSTSRASGTRSRSSANM